jgi:hypothetical protein
MKTTLDLADALLNEAKTLARAQRTTLRSLVEEGLRHVLAQKRQATGYQIKDCSFMGASDPDAISANWATLRDTVMYPPKPIEGLDFPAGGKQHQPR